MRRRAFTLIELVIAVAVIGAMAAIAVPTFGKARVRTTETSCAKNRKALQHAKVLWQMDHEKLDSDEVLFRDLIPEYVQDPPICPMGGTYDLNGLTGETSCTVHGK